MAWHEHFVCEKSKKLLAKEEPCLGLIFRSATKTKHAIHHAAVIFGEIPFRLVGGSSAHDCCLPFRTLPYGGTTIIPTTFLSLPSSLSLIKHNKKETSMAIELPKILQQDDQDYQAVGTSEEEAEYGEVAPPPIMRRDVVVSPVRRLVELCGAFCIGFLVSSLVYRHVGAYQSNKPDASIDRPVDTHEHRDSPSSSVVDKDELPLEERLKFSKRSDDNNMTYFRERKPTPSGWWPDEAWIQECVDKPRELTPFATLELWKDYRLGDCVKICAGCPVDFEPGKNDDLYKSPLAHWTMAGEYYDRDCAMGKANHMKRGNETLLDEIINSRQGQEGFYLPDPEAIVIHLRLGDKLEDSEASVFEMLQNSAEPGHRTFRGFNALKSLYEFLTEVVISEAPKVMIRGGSQIPDMYKKSKTYAYCIHEAFVEAGFDAEINMEEGNADYDFNYMVNAKKVITTVGGFSRFIGHMVLRRGGIVYG